MPNTHILRICCGHGICLVPGRPNEQDSWTGIYDGEAACLAQHIVVAARDTAQLGGVLCFSGADTRATTQVTEARSAAHVAAAANWWGYASIAENVLLDEFARCSLGNILGGLLQYRLAFGRYPGLCVVYTYSFKTYRMEDHFRALGVSGQVVGVNNPDVDGSERMIFATTGEARKFAALQDDPFGAAPQWMAQRQARNPWGTPPPICPDPELAAFIRWLHVPGSPPAPVPSWTR